MKFSKRTARGKQEAEQSMRDAASKFRELYEAEKGNISNVFKIDPIKGTYTIDVDKISNPELKAKGAAY